MTEIIQANPWLSMIIVATISAWLGSAAGLLTAALCSTGKSWGDK